MGRLRQTTLIIGEGLTEFYFFQSLRDVYKHLTIKPDFPKRTTIKELGEKIAEGVRMGYGHIYCVVDMDTKNAEPERTQYNKLKAKYSNPVNKPKLGIRCEVEFFETHPSTELFFLYYFIYTSRSYSDQDTLLRDLNERVKYEKTAKFFMGCRGLHSYLERNGGSLSVAVANANHSMEERLSGVRDYTYSELGRLMEKLAVL